MENITLVGSPVEEFLDKVIEAATMNKRIFPIKTSCLARFIARLDRHDVKWTSTPIIRRGNVVRYDITTAFELPSEAFPELDWVL